MRKSKYSLDTSVLLRLLVREPVAQFRTALKFLEELQYEKTTCFISDLVLAEAYFALQTHYGLNKAQALEVLSLLASDKRFSLNTYVLELLKTEDLASRKPGFVDRLIHGESLMRNQMLVSFEKAAYKLENTLLLSEC
jgi:predicted nucleic-acid-binding protein